MKPARCLPSVAETATRLAGLPLRLCRHNGVAGFKLVRDLLQSLLEASNVFSLGSTNQDNLIFRIGFVIRHCRRFVMLNCLLSVLEEEHFVKCFDGLGRFGGGIS